MLGPVLAQRALLKGALFIAVCAASAVGAAPALAHGGWGGWSPAPKAVYSETNAVTGNSIVAWARHDNGSLSLIGSFSTGGLGQDNQPPFGFPIVDSSESVRLGDAGHLLFAVNGGDNSVSSFVTTPWGPQLVSHVPSNGTLPISVAYSHHLLYVLNETTANISGYWVSRDGALTPIPGSSQGLAGGANSLGGQIGFAPGGRQITVTERGDNIIDTFTLGWNDRPGPAVANTSSGVTPFGFAYQGFNNLIVSDANVPGGFVSSASSYNLNPFNGKLYPVSTVSANGHATCWVVISNDQRYAFMSNTLSNIFDGGQNSISRFKLGPNGKLTLLGVVPSTAGYPTDIGQSADGTYLYLTLPSNVVAPGGPLAGSTSHIDEYREGSGGSLTYIGSTPSVLPDSLSGDAAW